MRKEWLLFTTDDMYIIIHCHVDTHFVYVVLFQIQISKENFEPEPDSNLRLPDRLGDPGSIDGLNFSLEI
jgi:hypothetical protein